MKVKPGTIGILFCLLATLPLLAQKSDLQLEVAPQSVEVESCDTGSPLLVIARNTGTKALSSVTVDSFSDAGLTLTPAPVPRVLAPHSESSWQFQINCGAEFASGHLQIILHGKGAGKAEQVLTQTVSVKLREPRSLDSLAAIEVKSGLESLHSGESGTLYLMLTNKTTKSIRATIKPEQPDLIFGEKTAPNPEGSKDDATYVAPLSSQIISFPVKARSRLTPGKKVLFYQVNLTVGGEARTFVASREIEVGVLGESEILKLLGVPSLFFLPGFLAVSVFQLLWRWKLWRPGGDDAVPLEEGKSGFWVVSITASLFITGLFLLGRKDFFFYYGLNDLMVLWFTSLGIGVATYWVFCWVREKRIRKQEKLKKELEDRYPQPQDDVITVLQKLKKNGQTLSLDSVKVKGSDTPLFLLASTEDAAYVSPRMRIIWKNDADAEIRGKVEDELTSEGDPGIVAALCQSEMAKEESLTNGIKAMDWVDYGRQFRTVRKIALGELEELGKKEILLESLDE